MIKIFNKPLLVLLFMVTTFGMLTSCDKNNDDVNSGNVELLSFGPTGARHGDTLRFFGNNLHQVTAIEFAGATIDKAAFIQQTPELILVKVPNETVQGFVTLKTSAGDIVSKTQFNLEVPVKITSVTAQARPGETITIKGDFLNWVNRVTFGLNKAVDTFVSKTLTELVVRVPMDAQTDKLILSTGGTEPLTIVTDNALVVTLPAATGLSPNPVKHAANLTITGTDLDLVRGVSFIGVSAPVTSFESQSATQLVVKVPGGAKDGKITLTAPSKVTVQSGSELKMVWPDATAFTPGKIDPETNVTITGTNLDLVTGITFSGVSAPVTSFVSQSATQIVVKAPPKALKGKLIFSVLNSTVTVESGPTLDFTGGLPPLDPLAAAIYTDALQNGFSDWGYGGTTDKNNSENVRDGAKSVKKTFTGWDAVRFAGSTLPTSGRTHVVFSVFGGPGMEGKEANLIINNNWGIKKFIIKEGEWVEFRFTMAELGNPASINDWGIQCGTPGVIYVDHVGLR